MLKVDIAGISGPVQFDENGRRIVSRLDILNLRNNSFKKVSSKKGMNNHIFFLALLIQAEFFWKRKTVSRLDIDYNYIFAKAPLNNNNNKLYLHDYNKVLQYCQSYLNLIIDSFLN